MYDAVEDFTNAREAQEWVDWMDWEGGLAGLLKHGGPDDFPPSMRDEAKALDVAYDALQERMNAVLKQWGVTY